MLIADWKRNVQILRFAQDDTFRFVVILSEAKDLYESDSDNVLTIPHLSVKNLFLLSHTFSVRSQIMQCLFIDFDLS